MEILTLIIVLLAGFASGFLLGKLLKSKQDKSGKEFEQLRAQLNEASTEIKIKSSDLENRGSEIVRLRKDLELLREHEVELNSQLSGSKADLKNMSEKLSGQKKELEEIREKFVHEFKNLAAEIVQKESKTFTQQNKDNIEALLKPLGEKIKDFEKKVEDTYDKESKQRFSLKEEVKRLSDLNLQISTDARNLTDALKGQSKTQGNWGELILESILEKSGLEKDREFFIQKSFKTETGRRMQPDVILSLPGNKNVVIDSKVSLTAYESYASAEADGERDAYLKSHIISVKKHVDELASKNYQHLYELNSLDFVIMFMPVEPAFLTAVKSDSALWSYAYEKGVLLIGPTNLFATLKMVSSLWKQEYQNRNVIEIAQQSGRLYDKFVGFVKDLTDIGDKLDNARKSYDQAMGKLSSGKGNLVSRAEKIKALGARTNKELPNHLTLPDPDSNE